MSESAMKAHLRRNSTTAASACCAFLLLGALCVVYNGSMPSQRLSLRNRRLQAWGAQQGPFGDPKTVEMKPFFSSGPPNQGGLEQRNPPPQGGWDQGPLTTQQDQHAGMGGTPDAQGGGGSQQNGSPPAGDQVGLWREPIQNGSGTLRQQQGGFFGDPLSQQGSSGVAPSDPQQGGRFPPQQQGDLPPSSQQQGGGFPPQQQGGLQGPPPDQQQSELFPRQQQDRFGGPPQQGGLQGPPPDQQQSELFPPEQQDRFGGPPHNVVDPSNGGNFGNQVNAIQQQQAHPIQPGMPIDPNSPSYVQLCTEFLNRREYNDGYQPSEIFIVREPKEFCSSPDTFVSLMTMIVSSMVAQASSMWRLSYQHGCETTTDLTTATIQQMMPNDLTLAMGAGIEAVTNICKKALQDPVALKHDGHYAFGFPKEGLYNVDPALNANRVTAFRHNIYFAVNKVNRLENLLHIPPVNLGAVIYMDLQSLNVPKLPRQPVEYYTSKLPSTVPAIALVVSPACQQVVDCVNYVNNLQGLLTKIYSSIPVTVEAVPSTSVAMARLMDAPLLVCPPTMMCLLPALWRPVQQPTYLSHSPELYPWFQYMVREATKSFHLPLQYEKKE